MASTNRSALVEAFPCRTDRQPPQTKNRATLEHRIVLRPRSDHKSRSSSTRSNASSSRAANVGALKSGRKAGMVGPNAYAAHAPRRAPLRCRCRRVFHHHAAVDRRSEPRCGSQEHLRVGLTPRHILRSDDRRKGAGDAQHLQNRIYVEPRAEVASAWRHPAAASRPSHNSTPGSSSTPRLRTSRR